MDKPTKTRVRVEGGSFHTWTPPQLRAFTPDSAFAPAHSYKSSGFRTILNTRQPKETQPDEHP